MSQTIKEFTGLDDGWVWPTQYFDGHRLHNGTAVQFVNGKIAALSDNPPAEAVKIDAILSPGFFDIQVNGGGDVMFNDDPSPDGLHRMARAHQKGGTTRWLPTVITDAPQALAAAVDGMIESFGRFGIAGIHIEGPHIAIERKGTHKPVWIRPFEKATLAHIRRLREHNIPVMITVAPEAMQPGDIRTIVQTGALVSLGHTDGSADMVARAMDEGATLFTHLYNAMSQMQNRAPGTVGAGIASDGYCSVIVDGHHVAYPMVGIAVRARPTKDRMIIVTDAMATVGGSRSFALYGNRIHLEDGKLVNAEGSLAGAHITMIDSVANMVNHVGVSLEDTLKMATSNPAAALGLGQDIGTLKVGDDAEYLLIAPDLSGVRVIGSF